MEIKGLGINIKTKALKIEKTGRIRQIKFEILSWYWQDKIKLLE